MTSFETDLTHFSIGIKPLPARDDFHPHAHHSHRVDGRGGPTSCPTGHEWVVFSTAVMDQCLMVQCVECGAMGTVDDSSEEEWSEAWHAPSRPYRWRDTSRVTPRGEAPLHVTKVTGSPPCECHARLGPPQVGDFERFPAEIMGPLEGLTDEARAELREVADSVGESDLCSLLFPHFVRSFEDATGHRHSDALHEVVRRIERIDSKGLHCSPGVVAEVLRRFASQAE